MSVDGLQVVEGPSTEPQDVAGAHGDDASEETAMMVVSRARRPNAGRRMGKLLQEEAAEIQEFYNKPDWQDAADDGEFEAAEDEQDDIPLESSSDEDEDKGNADEDAGERELRTLERADRLAKKRKQRDALVNPSLRKKVKLAEPPAGDAPSAAASRPRKKSERVSWLAPDVAPTRSSSRMLAVRNREETHERLKEKETKRLHTVAIMRAAELRKEEAKPKALTQAERMAEAARVERQNSKSLNRWEETERRRVEEQKAKLDALKNRTLEGPFIRSWSGPAVWVNNRLKHVGKGSKIEEIADQPEPRRKPKEVSEAAVSVQVPPATSDSRASESRPSDPEEKAPASQPSGRPPDTTAPDPTMLGLPSTIMFAPPDGINNFPWLPGTREAAAASDNALQDQDPAPAPAVQPPPPSPPPPPPPKRVIERALRNLIVLQSFENLDPRDRNALSNVLFQIQKLKLAKPPSTMCCITGLPARYRDPATGLPYHNAFAYKSIQRLVAGSFRWSNLLGAYVGPSCAYGARKTAAGVPERFLGIKKTEQAPVESGIKTELECPPVS